MQENLKKKYGITEEELSRGIDLIAKNLGKICNVDVLLALSDLLANGDIKEDEN